MPNCPWPPPSCGAHQTCWGSLVKRCAGRHMQTEQELIAQQPCFVYCILILSTQHAKPVRDLTCYSMKQVLQKLSAAADASVCASCVTLDTQGTMPWRVMQPRCCTASVLAVPCIHAPLGLSKGMQEGRREQLSRQEEPAQSRGN